MKEFYINVPNSVDKKVVIADIQYEISMETHAYCIWDIVQYL